MATEQIAVRLPEALLAGLDELVKSGAYGSRAAAVRAGIEAIMKLEVQRQTDLAIVRATRGNPTTGDTLIILTNNDQLTAGLLAPQVLAVV